MLLLLLDEEEVGAISKPSGRLEGGFLPEFPARLTGELDDEFGRRMLFLGLTGLAKPVTAEMG